MNDDSIIEQLDLSIKKIFLQTFMKLVCSDGKVEKAEKLLMSDTIKRYKIPVEMFDEVRKPLQKAELFNILKNTITNRHTALFLIKELLNIANIDEDIAETEAGFIDDVAKTLNIDEDKVLAINKLVLDRKLWIYENDSVMENIQIPEKDIPQYQNKN